MAEVQFHLDDAGQGVLTVSWQGFFSDVRVRLGDLEIGKVYAFEELLKGTDFKLPDSSTVRLTYGLGGLTARRDGVLLARTESGKVRALRPAAWALYFVGVQSVFLGLVMIFFRGTVFGIRGVGPVAFIFGLLYIGLGVGVQRGKLAVLYGGMGLYLLESVVSVGLGLATGQTPGVFNLFLRVLLVGFMATGLQPLGALEEDA